MNVEKIKLAENESNSIVDEIPNHFPALLHAQNSKKSRKRWIRLAKWEWAKEKLVEECQELLNAKSENNINEEIGDILFSITNICRKLNKSGRILITRYKQKFKKRFKTTRGHC